jgi:hypothetical protein
VDPLLQGIDQRVRENRKKSPGIVRGFFFSNQTKIPGEPAMGSL